jgi:5-methyltetrahydropteroyltriglutamate--homocysteine methyltransferase
MPGTVPARAALARPDRRPWHMMHRFGGAEAGIEGDEHAMKRSDDRILVTHAGSLPRPADLLAEIHATQAGEPIDREAHAAHVRDAVSEIVRRQVQCGIDIVSDGELSKPSFLTYVNDRLGGFELAEHRDGNPWAASRDAIAFPSYYERPLALSGFRPAVCTGPVTYTGHAALQADLDNLATAVAQADAVEAFVPAISPANIEGSYENRYYGTQEEYLFALADAMHEEYRAIVDAGFLLQIDDPRLVTYYMLTPEATIEDTRRWAQVRVDALNHALRDIAPDRVRHHTCYSIDVGPRVHDLELRHIIDLLLQINAGAYSFEAANPRHEHEWRVWGDVELPEDKLVIPGVITHSTVLVEHPELVAERLAKFAGLLGSERVIAGADCGFATLAAGGEVPGDVAWVKLDALVEGARLASARLWQHS